MEETTTRYERLTESDLRETTLGDIAAGRTANAVVYDRAAQCFMWVLS